MGVNTTVVVGDGVVVYECVCTELKVDTDVVVCDGVVGDGGVMDSVVSVKGDAYTGLGVVDDDVMVDICVVGVYEDAGGVAGGTSVGDGEAGDGGIIGGDGDSGVSVVASDSGDVLVLSLEQ